MTSRTVARKQKKRPGTAGEAIMWKKTRNKGERGERGWGGLELRDTGFIGQATIGRGQAAEALKAPTPRYSLTSSGAPIIGHQLTCPICAPSGLIEASSVIHLAFGCAVFFFGQACCASTAELVLYGYSNLLACRIVIPQPLT